MRKNAKLFIATGALLLVVLAIGLHWAWQEGMVPASVLKPSPRAPLPEVFLDVLRNDPVVAQTLKSPCVQIYLHANRGIDRMGRPGLPYQKVPGLDVMTIAQVPGDSGQQVGLVSQALEALTKAGIYKAEDAEVDDGKGNKLPARTYSLTVSGWAAMREERCLNVGTPKISAIAEFSRIVPDNDGKRVYEVKAQYAPQNPPTWINDPAVLTLAPQYQGMKLNEPATATYRLQRTETGWKVQHPENEPPELSPALITELLAKSRTQASTQACIRLPGKDSAPGLGVVIAPYSVTLYEIDIPDEIYPRYSMQSLWQSRLTQMVAAGIFKVEEIPPNPQANVPRGTRYVLDPGYQQWIDLNDARCLRMGDSKLELVAYHVQQQPKREAAAVNFATATAKYMLRLDKESWINSSTLKLPEIDAMREAGGIPVIARLGWNDRDKDMTWKFSSIQPISIDPIQPKPLPSHRDGDTQNPSSQPRSPGQPAATPTSEGDVTWQGKNGNTLICPLYQQSMTVTYCGGSSPSTILASQGINSGKAYAELTLRARPLALSAEKNTSAGLVPLTPADRGSAIGHPRRGPPVLAFQNGTDIAHNDVIGIAVDMDNGKVYFSQNGKWLNGAPGSSGGTALPRGMTYYIAAQVSASHNSPGTDRWTANFGKTRFRYTLPRGYKSYDGRQRG